MAGPSNPPVGNTIIPVGVKMRGGPKLVKPPHASTPHSTNTTTTKNVPSWLNTAALTPAQMEAEALKEANDSISPQVSGLQGQQANYDAQQKAYEAAMTGFYAALAPYMAGIQGHVSDAYNSAAATMGDIGHGYAGVLGTAAAADNAETNAALARAGQAPIAAPGAGLTDAFAAEHGGIDGSSFAAQGAAKAADAAHQPAIWAASGRDNLAEAISKAVAGDKTYADQIKQVYAQVPALRNTILKEIQSAELDKQKLKFDENFKVGQANEHIDEFNAKQSLAQQKAIFDTKYKIAGLKLRGQSLQLQANKFAQSVYNSDRNYALALTRVGISQKKAQLAAIAAEYKLKSGGFTPQQMSKFNGLLQAGLNGIVVHNNPDGTTTYTRPKDKTGKVMVPTSYSEFISQAVAHGIPPSLAIARADKFFPPEDRPQGPNPLDSLLGTGGNPNAGGRGAPLQSPGKFERIDQGVDFMASSPVKSLVPGRVVSITKGMAGGTGHIIKILLDKPVTINGRTYYGIYYSEQSPLVKVGQHVPAGVPIMGAGGNEIGFLDQHMQMPTLIGGLGAGSRPSVGGQDFYAWLGG